MRSAGARPLDDAGRGGYAGVRSCASGDALMLADIVDPGVEAPPVMIVPDRIVPAPVVRVSPSRFRAA